MNINFSKFFQKSLPFIYVIFFAYIINLALFFYLPKSGTSFILNSFSNLDYKKFGFYSNIKKLEQSDTKAINQPQDLSKYELKAIYFINSNKGWITVEDKSNQTSYILSLQEQVDGYTFSKLFKNYVIFQKDKKEYKLEIVEKELTNYQENSVDEFKAKDNGAVINRNYLNSYTTDMEKIWKNITISEVKNANKTEGFKIEKINKDSVFAKIGLKEGDIIKSINNTPLSSPSEAFKVYGNIGNIKYLNIEISRNNEIMEMSYEIN
jgi:type II secretion system protein C